MAATGFIASFAGSFGAVLLFMLIVVGGTGVAMGLGVQEDVAGAIGFGCWLVVRYFIKRRFRDDVASDAS